VQRRGKLALTVRRDVSIEDDVTELFDAAADLGPLAGVVNNAAITGNTPGRLDEQKAETVRRVLDVNVGGVFLCCREAVRRMSTRYGGAGGASVNLSSTAARTGSAGESVHYAATKAAVETLTFGLAQEVAREGVRVKAEGPREHAGTVTAAERGPTGCGLSRKGTVAPGMVETGLHEAAGMPDRLDRIAPTIPLGRAARPQEIAEAVLWFLSPEASYALGSVLTVGGGR
jgi:NAD(P)-dependent dehydrogenase (short-subunit alcohol dehydrogenase family)